jgi:hypothetical protein
VTKQLILSVLAAAALAGCGKAEGDAGVGAAPAKPKQAAAQLEQAFAGAPAEVKQYANAASKALQAADYEGAIQSLHLVQQQGTLTLEQGMAVHHSMVSMETRLIQAINAGDENAKRAYEQLKKARRN